MSQTFKVEISMDNAATDTAGGVIDVLERVIAQLREHPGEAALFPVHSRSIRDVNGNTVGGWNVEGMPDRDHPGQ